MKKPIVPWRWVCLALVGVAWLSGCRWLPLNPTDACRTDDQLFADTFDHEQNANLCGWAVYRTAGVAVEVENSALTISISDAGQMAWTNPGRSFTDVEVTAQTRQLSGPNDNAYGLICRYRDEQNFYVFLISGDGFYAIGKYTSASPQVEYLTGAEYLPSNFINQGDAANRIGARCVGDALSLPINGELVATVRDSSHAAGDIGLAASPFGVGRLVVAFDSVQASQP